MNCEDKRFLRLFHSFMDDRFSLFIPFSFIIMSGHNSVIVLLLLLSVTQFFASSPIADAFPEARYVRTSGIRKDYYLWSSLDCVATILTSFPFDGGPWQQYCVGSTGTRPEVTSFPVCTETGRTEGRLSRTTASGSSGDSFNSDYH